MGVLGDGGYAGVCIAAAAGDPSKGSFAWPSGLAVEGSLLQNGTLSGVGAVVRPLYTASS